jgi:hypothetical protein
LERIVSVNCDIHSQKKQGDGTNDMKTHLANHCATSDAASVQAALDRKFLTRSSPQFNNPMKTTHRITSVLTLLMTAMALLGFNSSFAAPRTASVSGNWSSTATWGGLSVPVAGDTVTINTGITVTVDTNNAACTSVAIGTGNGTATLTFAASGSPQLTVSGSVTVGNSGNANRVGVITFTSGSTLICGSLTHGTTGSQASSINMTSGGTLQVNGAITVNSSGATFTPGSGSVILTANNTLPNATFTSFNNLTVNSGTTTLGVNVSILGNLSVSGGALDLSTFTANRSSAGGTLTVADGATMILGGTANFPLNYTTYSLGATSMVTYDNNGNQTVSPRSYGNLTFSGSGAKSITNSAMSVAGNLSIAPTGSATANISAGLTNNVGSLTLGGLGRAAGLWGGNTSGGNFTNTTYFAATTGKLNVATDTRVAPVVTTWPTASAIAYGSALSSSTLSGGSAPAGTFAFTSPATIPTTTGVFVAEVSYTPNDMTAYNTGLSNNVNVTVNPKALTVTGITANGKVYDRTTVATLNTGAATLVGVVGADDVSLNTASATGTFSSANVGSRTATVSGLTLTGVDSAKYTVTSPTTAAVNITAKPLTVSGGSVTSKTYNGNTTATINTSGMALVGLISPDTATLNTGSATGTYDNKNVGTNKPVQISGLTISGGQSANYSVTQPTNSGNITVRTLTVSATGVNKVYDGTTNATVTLTDNRISGDVLSTAYTNAGFTSASVGNGKTVNVSGISISGTDAGNYTPNATAATTANITALAVQVSGSRIYDGTTNISGSDLTVANSLDGANVSLTGTGLIAARHVGSQAVSAGATAARIQSTTGSANATSIAMSALGSSPVNGNTLIAVISTRGTAQNQVTGITQTGATWTRVVQSGASTANPSTTEIWYAPNVSGAGTAITINLATSLRAAAVVMEYSGLLTASSVDATNSNFANGTVGTAATTGTTPTTSQANELWIGGIAFTNSSYTLGSIQNSFTSVANVSSSGGTAATRLYALERIVTSTGTASSGGTISTASLWSGAVATFRSVTASGSPLALTGSAATNYTLAGMSGSATITAKALTTTGLTADNKIYDGNTAATLSGSAALQTSEAAGTGTTADGIPYSLDTVSVSGTASGSFADKNVGVAKPVSVTGLSLAGANAGNYSLTAPSLSADITALGLTGSITADNKVYDGNNSATITSRSLSGVIGAEDVSLNGGTATFNNKHVGIGKTVTATGMTLSGADAGNYSAPASAPGTADISVRSLTVSATAQNKQYDGNTTAPVSFSDDRIGGDVLSASATAADFDTKDIGTAKPVSITGISISGADAGNYSLTGTTANSSADITVRPLTPSITASNKVYDGNASATIATRSLTGVVGAEDVSLTGGTATFNNKNVGNGKPVSATGLSLSGADIGNYSLASTTANTTADITAMSLAGSVTLTNKVYDGGTNAIIVDRSVTGMIGGEDVSLTGGAANYDDKNVGTNKNVTITGLVLSGADAGNYVLSPATLTGAADITERTLTVSATAANKAYDGNDSAIVTLSDDRASGDVLSASHTAANFDNKNVGVGKPVSVTGISISGADAANYLLSNVSASSSADITAASLTASATANNKVYDGNNSATIATRSLSGVIGADDVTLSGGSATFNNKNVGIGKPVAVVGMILGGADMANYSLASGDANTTADITAASLTASATANNKVYDGNNSASIASRSLSGVIGADDVTLSGGSATFNNKNVGIGKPVAVVGMILGGADMANYSLASGDANTTADITAASLTASATANNKVYDGNNSASIASRSLSGVIGADDVTLSGGSATFNNKNVGIGKPVAVVGMILGGADMANYSLASGDANTTADITAASLTASATANNKVYDGNNSATIATRSLSGVIGADDVTLSGGSATFNNKNVGIGKPVAVVGMILGGADMANYSLASGDANTTADITAASLTASATANNKVYDGTNSASIASRSLSGVIGADDVTLSGGTATFNNKNVGIGKPVAVVGMILGGADMANYSLASGSANTTANITAIALTVTADDASRNYGAANPVFTGTMTGMIAGDNITASYSTTATAASPVGTYAITPSLNDPDNNLGNYAVTLNNGTLTIISLAPSNIGSIQQMPDGNMHIVVNGTPGQVYHLQAVGDLNSSAWSNISTNTANGLGVVEFDDLSATNHMSRFYRISTP